MFPIRVERDVQVFDWVTHDAWGTVDQDPSLGTQAVHSDGVLYTNVATVSSRASTGAIAAQRQRCLGVHLTGPEPGDEFTLYSIQASAVVSDENALPCLWMGESPATITTAAAGDNVAEVKLIQAGVSSAVIGGTLRFDGVVAVNENTADRGVCFFVGVRTNLVGAADSVCNMSMTARRLIDVQPRVIDVAKLG